MTDGPIVVGGRYQLQELVGRGGMAEVHRGLDLRLERPVAVKRLSIALAADPTAQTRFRREAQAAASLNDPAIASVFDTGEDIDPGTQVPVPYIVMELVEGSTLRALLADGPLPVERSLQITGSVLDALAHSHAAGIVHRDIKPANVMLTPAGAVKVMDFGIARAVDDTSTHLTQTSAVIGTAHYLSPEQARGESVDLRSDLYSVGCLLFELLTGRPPFVGESSISVAYQHVREDPVPPSRINPQLSPAIDAVVLHALAKDPTDRYSSARAMRSDVDVLLADLNQATAATRLAAPGALAAAGSAAAAVGGTTEATAAGTGALPGGSADFARPAAAGRPPASAAAGPQLTDPPADDREERRRGAGLRQVLLAATAVLLVVGLGAFGLVRALGPDQASMSSVVVPSMVGSTRAEAEARLRAAGLVPRFREVRGKAGTTVNTVTGQTPAPGGAVEPGSTVTLQVNIGPASSRVPNDLVGLDVDEVEKKLAASGFTDVRPESVPNPGGDVAPDQVVSLRPVEGSRLALDETIVVRYAGRADDGGASGAGTTSNGGSGGGSSSGDGRGRDSSRGADSGGDTSRGGASGGDANPGGNSGASGGTGGQDGEPESTRSPDASASSEPTATTGPTSSASPQPDSTSPTGSNEPTGPTAPTAPAEPSEPAAPAPTAKPSPSTNVAKNADKKTKQKAPKKSAGPPERKSAGQQSDGQEPAGST